MNDASYQLTKYPTGSLREIWSIAWPLICGFLSLGSMIVIDRLFLSHYSIYAFTAAANAGTAVFFLLVAPTSVAAIAEIFVGKYNGEKNFTEVGKPVWQMIWFSIFSSPIIWYTGSFLKPFLFYNTGNEALENAYFSTSLAFTPIFCIEIALGSFFIGIGRIKIVALGILLANIINILLDVLLIFGYGSLPPLGAMGAAIATGMAQVFQVIFYSSIFLNRENKQKYHTQKCSFNWPCFKECLLIGLPSGFGRFSETFAHLLFFRMMIMAGGNNLVIASIIQSIFIFFNCCSEGISEAVTTIIANLFGGRQAGLMKKVVHSALLLHFIFFLGAASLFTLIWKPIIGLFFSEKDALLLSDPIFVSTLEWSFISIGIFYLFDGFCWVFIGHLTAITDTKFIFVVSLLSNCLLFIVPAFIIVYFFGGNIVQGCLVMAIYSFSNFIIFRYRSRTWIPKTILVSIS